MSLKEVNNYCLEFIIEPKFDGAGSFLEGLAPVKINEKWGYIGKV